MQLQVKASFAKSEGWKTHNFTDLVIHEERPNAIKISASGFTPDSANCWYCNKPLATMESIRIGVGPICANAIGIPKKIRGDVADWYKSKGKLDEVWIPRSVIRFPHNLRLAIPENESTNIDYGKWSTTEDCKGTLTLGYSPSDKHHMFDNLVCLEIFCEMSLGFHSQILSVRGAEWQGKDKSVPSWRNARDIGAHKVWTFPFDKETTVEVFKLCEVYSVNLEVESSLAELVKVRRRAELDRVELVGSLGLKSTEEIKKMSPEDLDLIAWDDIVKTNPYNHQKAALAMMATLMNLNLPGVKLNV